jgi:hypothetical protein
MGEDEKHVQDDIAGNALLEDPPLDEEGECHTWGRQAVETPEKVKYPRSDTIDRLVYEHAHAPTAREAQRKCGELIVAIYEHYKPQIIRLVRKYGNFTNHSDEEDMSQTAYLALIDLLRTYENSVAINMKLSTFLDWKISNACQKYANNTKDVFVEITTRDGALYKRVSYNEWQAIKKTLTARGYTGTTVRPQQLSTLFENEGGPDDNIATSIADMDEPLVEPEVEDPKESEPLIEPDQDIHREIDSIHRTARHVDIGSPAGSHVLRKVYELYRHRLFALASQYSTDGAAAESLLQKAAEAEIVMTWKTYSDNIVPGARYSLYLESIMRRKLPVLLRRD